MSPTDTYHDFRGEMVYEMRKVGIASKRIITKSRPPDRARSI